SPPGAQPAGAETGKRRPRTAARPLVDCALAGVSTPRPHPRGARAGARPGAGAQEARARARAAPLTRAGPRARRTGRRDNRKEGTMPVVTRRELLEAGVHFGHQTRRWNPKMGRYLYGERS